MHNKLDEVSVMQDTTINHIDVLMLRMLVDYMANGMVGPFQVLKVVPTVMQKVTRSKKIVFQIVGPDLQNRLKLEFFEKAIASDICYALNRVYGFEDLVHWTPKLED